MPRQKRSDACAEKGAVTLMTALILPLLMAAGAFAIDLAHAHVVRSEMQNDADAAALAGAHALIDPATGQLQWSGAATKALQAIGLNRAAGQALVDGHVQTGYWNLQAKPATLQSLPMTPGAWDVPAVSVQLFKSKGHNHGPAPTFLARLWGVLGIDLQVSAVAAPTSPGTMLPGGLFPLAMADCMYRDYWNTTPFPGSPKLDPATGKPYVFKLGSSYHYGACSSAEWTSLLDDKNDVRFIRDLIDSGNPAAVGIGQDIWVEPGTKTTLFKKVQDCSAAGDRSCEYVVVPTVSQVDTHAHSPVQGLACLHILDASTSGKYVLAEMSTKCPSSLAGGVGPSYGVLAPPSLVR